MRTIIIYEIIILLILLSCNSIISNNSNPFMLLSSSLSILRNRRGLSKNDDRDSVIIEFDEYGGLPQLKNTLVAVSKGSTIVAIRTSNTTILGYTTSKSGKYNLEVSLGGKPFYSLGNKYQYILVTGIIGDCRAVCRHAKQIALNHTMEFDYPPSGLYIANELARYLQKFTMSGTRPMAVHIFIADALTNGINIDEDNPVGKLYEVDTSGNVLQIKAGCAGRNSVKAKEILENEINGTMTNDEAINLARKILLKIDGNDTAISELKENIYSLSDFI